MIDALSTSAAKAADVSGATAVIHPPEGHPRSCYPRSSESSHGALLDSRCLLDGMAMHPEMNLNLELIEAATILRHEQVLLHRLEKRGISGVEVGVNEM